MDKPLQNRTIALAETRELDLLAFMLESEGAKIVRCPLVTIHDTADESLVVAWIRCLIAGDLEDAIFYTGEGVRRLLGFSERAGVREDFVAALARVRKITRGPKPVRALREIGLSPDITASAPTTAGLIETLTAEELRSRAIGVQIYGQEPNAELLSFLKERGAVAYVVAPYVYASEADDRQVEMLIRQMANGEIAAILFTSSPQVQRLARFANRADLSDILTTGFEKTRIGAIGPIVRNELESHGLQVSIFPDGPFTMKPLVRAVVRMFQESPGA